MRPVTVEFQRLGQPIQTLPELQRRNPILFGVAGLHVGVTEDVIAVVAATATGAELALVTPPVDARVSFQVTPINLVAERPHTVDPAPGRKFVRIDHIFSSEATRDPVLLPARVTNRSAA